jgi:hypothetical protein
MEVVGFNDWIEERFRVSTTPGWASIIAHDAQDEFDAIEQALALI